MRVIWALVVVAGCARAPTQSASPSAAPAMLAPDPHAQIEALDREISDELARGRIAAPVIEPCSGARCAEAMSTPAPAEPACSPGGGARCTDVCTLSGSICDNQGKICELAGQLPGDDWAANKCAAARGSCKAARAACCACVQ